MTIQQLRTLVRPLMIMTLIVLIGPVAVASGLVNTIWDGAGERFNAAFIGYLSGLPESFWAFAGLVTLGHQASRSFDKAKEAEAIEAYAGLVKDPNG
jgi:hypothetical protein